MNREYFELLRNLWEQGEVSSPRNLIVKEIIGHSFILNNSTYSLITIPGFETNKKYAEKELEWYLSGSNNISYLKNFGHCWKFCSDDGKHVNSAYGHRIFGMHKKIKINQWQWCLKKFNEDVDTRQTVINLNSAFDKQHKTKDFVCTIFCQPIIRNNRLHWITCMRSSDVVLGIRNDVFCFTALQRIMAFQLGIPPGKYYHFTTSLHIYKKHFEKLKKVMHEYSSPSEFYNIRYQFKIKELIKKFSKNLGGDKNWILKK